MNHDDTQLTYQDFANDRTYVACSDLISAR